MPTITVSKKEVLKTLGKKLSDEQLKDRIGMLGTDLEGIEGDDINVEIFPNRPDLLSQQGFQRALASFVGVKPGLKKYDVKKSGEKVIVKNLPKEWSYAVACIVKGLKFDDQKIKEVVQLQEKLGMTFTRNRKKGGIGLYPLEKISFPVTFTGKKPKEIKFRPLEFPREIDAEQILEHHPKGKEYGFIMDGWKTYPVFVDDKGTYMSMPPIINSHDVGKIDETTTDIFVECTGPHLRTIVESLAMLTTALADMGGKIYSIEMVYPDKKFSYPDLTPKKMRVDHAYINKLLGLKLTNAEIGKYLERMGFGYENGKALIPAYRTDILHQADFAEDVAIAYGYENFKEVIPNIATVGGADKFETFCDKVRNLLVGHGLLEAKNFHLINHDAQTKRMLLNFNTIKVLHPVSLEYDSLRAWIIPSLIEALQRNKRYEYPQHFFEIGRVFSKAKPADKSDTGVKEQVRVAVALCGEDADYTAIRQVLDDLLTKLNVQAVYKETEHPSFIPGRVARVYVGKEAVAYIGELHPQVLANFDMTMPIATFELNLSVVGQHLA